MHLQQRLLTVAMLTRLCLACGDDRHGPAEDAIPAIEQPQEPNIPVVTDLPEADDGDSLLLFATAARGISPVGHTDLCLDAQDASQEPGTKVQLWTCHDGTNQDFLLRDNALTVFADKCVSVANARNQDGATVRLKACDKSKVSQAWHQEGKLLRWANTDKCLDVTDGEFKDGALLQIWTCDPHNENQQFTIDGSPASTPAAPAAQGKKLDLSKWRQETYAAGTFNHEQERYTNGNRNVSFAADGTATITARKEGGQWTSARLTGDEVGSLPAYYEATITCPKGKGTWPAFWLTSRGAWPQGGEIDIMEQINGNGQTHWSNHWGASSGKPTFNTHESMGGLDLSKPHRYGGYITKDGVQFYVDGKKVGKWVTYPAQSNFSKIASQMVPIVNLAMGGDWPGSVPSSTGEQTMIVHSVVKGTTPP